MEERQRAEERYRLIRHDAMGVLMQELKESFIDAQLTDIDQRAVDIASIWRSYYPIVGKASYEPMWDWAKELKRFRRRPRRVELAIWHQQQLCGMALGRISNKCVVATIHLIEANPGNHPLKSQVAPIAARYLAVLAVGLNIREISIESPVIELIGFYKNLGFTKEVKKGQKILRLKRVIE